MAITRAQQARQMYKKGSKPVEQAGVMNYMPSEMVTVPKIAKSSPDTPTAKLAYITPKEEDILVDLNLYGSLDGKPNRGPGGLPSLEGDFGPGGNNPGGFEGGGGSRGDKDTVGTTDRGTGDYQVTDTKAQQDYNRSRAIRDYNRRQVENIGKKKNPIANFFSNIPTPFNLVKKFANKFGPLNNLDFYNEKVVPAGKKTFKNYEDYMSQRMAGTIDAYGNPISQDNNGDGNNVLTLQQLLAEQNAAQQQSNTTDPVIDTDPAIPYRLMAEGGIMNAMDEDVRQQLFLGGVAKGIKKAVKGATRAVKKIAKSKVGKAALLAAGGYYLGGGNLFGLQRAGMSGFSFGNLPGATSFSNFFRTKGLPNLAKGQIGVDKFGNAIYNRATGNTLTNLLSGMSTGKKAALGIGALASLPLLGIGTGDDEEEREQDRGPGLDIAGIRRNPYLAMQRTGNPYRLMAEGGDTEDAEPVAKKTMPLLDMGGKEKDYRETGGFVDMGRMEKADDVPARLSKNEFVFTADAVRNAGEGDIDKGAEVMYNMMKNLESGGEVSEESQGLEGAKKMFQTSQRLEGVM